MNTIKRILAGLALSILMINGALAADITPIFKVEGNKLYLSLDNVATQTSVRILDPAGFVWIDEKVAEAKSFKKVFDLASLPHGSYRLVIKASGEEIVQPITVSGAELVVDESKRTAYFEASLSQKREQVHLSLSNPSRSVVRFFVLDEKGRMVQQTSIEGQSVIDTDFDLKHLPGGYYTVVVDNGHESFTKRVSLR